VADMRLTELQTHGKAIVYGEFVNISATEMKLAAEGIVAIMYHLLDRLSTTVASRLGDFDVAGFPADLSLSFIETCLARFPHTASKADGEE
jgi:hypothetical protein